MMLHINDLTYRIEGRVLFDQATAAISDGWKVGVVGRNGTGKSTLLKLIREEIAPDDGSLTLRKGRRIGSVAQEAPATQDSLLDTVLAADTERGALLSEAETASDPARIAEIQTRLADIDAHSAEARAAIILSGLGFNHENQQRPCADFSGGWRMRVALAAVLFSAPDLLLLDEPTNYLDMEGALWLESYIRRYPYTALIVSHDRGLLNSAVTHIMALEHGKLSVHNGDYDTWERRRAEQRALAMAQASKQEAARRHMQAFVDRFRAKASKAKQAQSRLKMLERMQTVAIPLEERTIPFHFPDPKPPMAPPIVRVVEAGLGYEEGKPVLRDVNLRIDQDDRIAILGANGQGKSTLVKAISGRLAPLTGNVYKSKKLRIAYFSQHQIDELKPKQSAYDHVRALMPDGTEAEVRARTAQIGFGPDKADVAAEKLSGGEKARLLFGLITFEGPHLMILDEPTNHLDIDSREALMVALGNYQGAVILITHDAHLAEAVADRLWLVKDGKAERFEGDLSDYRRLILDANRTDRPAEKVAPAGQPQRPAVNKAEQRKAAADMRQALRPLKKRCEDLEARMETLHGEIAKIDSALAAPGLFETDLDKATALSKQRARAAEALQAAEEEWLVAGEAYESARTEAEQALES